MKTTTGLLAFSFSISLLAGCGQTTDAPSGSEQATGQTEAPASEATTTDDPTSTPFTTSAEGKLVTNGGAEISLASLEHYTEDETAPVVYYLSDITPEAKQPPFCQTEVTEWLFY